MVWLFKRNNNIYWINNEKYIYLFIFIYLFMENND